MPGRVLQNRRIRETATAVTNSPISPIHQLDLWHAAIPGSPIHHRGGPHHRPADLKAVFIPPGCGLGRPRRLVLAEYLPLHLLRRRLHPLENHRKKFHLE